MEVILASPPKEDRRIVLLQGDSGRSSYYVVQPQDIQTGVLIRDSEQCYDICKGITIFEKRCKELGVSSKVHTALKI